MARSRGPVPRAVVFRTRVAGARAFALATGGQREVAVREARRALALHPHDDNARLVLASDLLQHGAMDAAGLQLDSLLTDNPAQAGALRLKRQIAGARSVGAGSGASSSPFR
jgi:hypothetical protein